MASLLTSAARRRRICVVPLWDNNIRLDHSVRTVTVKALTIANSDRWRSDAGSATSPAIAALVRVDRRRATLVAQFVHVRALSKCALAALWPITRSAGNPSQVGRGGDRDVQLLGALALTPAHQPAYQPHGPAGRFAGRCVSPCWMCARAAPGVGPRTRPPAGHDEINALEFRPIRLFLSVRRTILPRRSRAARLRQAYRNGISARRQSGDAAGVVSMPAKSLLARDAGASAIPAWCRVAASADTRLPVTHISISRIPNARALDDLLVVLSAGPTTLATIALDRTIWGRLLLGPFATSAARRSP